MPVGGFGHPNFLFLSFNKMATFLLDNSALNQLLNDPILTNKLIDLLLKNTHHRVVVSLDSIQESFSGDYTYIEHIFNRATALKLLIDSIPYTHLIIARNSFDWLKAEKNNLGCLKNIPSLTTTSRWPGFLDFLSDKDIFFRFHKNLQPTLAEKKSRSIDLKEVDKKFRLEVKKENIQLSEIEFKLLNFDLTTHYKDLLLFSSALEISNKLCKRIIFSNNNRYLVHKVYLSALYIRSLGNALDNFQKNPTLKFLEKLKIGNWFDLGIISISSQFDYLVTNDSDQKDFCNYLNEKSMSKSKGINLKSFFEQLIEL